MTTPSRKNPASPSRKAAPTAALVEVRVSALHGRGIFAARDLARDTVLGLYAGRRYAPEYVSTRDWDQHFTHVFALSDGSFIDGADGGNELRFLNHSCVPNCIAYEVEVRGGLAIQIEARKAIRHGAELTIDYALDIGTNDPVDYVCRCGARRCRGSLAAPAAT